ncbi:NAD(P)-dependent oxidoreductase [Microbispora sp. NPDC049125]|uniref:NAD(P)-dependent oxidoreductase n=1 Tax=Microbispora sp. NPDC049125 TaxID=3154929 RepID=UPI003467B9FE
MRTAVLGMGGMGRALARRMLKNEYSVTVWNRTPGKAGDVVDDGGVEAGSPEEAVRGADAVLLSLSDDDAVREVVARLDGIEDGVIVVDTSTVSPGTSRALRATVPGGRFLAAPIAGGPVAVVEGTATTLVGGERRLVDRLDPIWKDVFASWSYCGEDPGSATAFKLLSNYLMMAGLAVLAEVAATAQAAGLDDQLTRDFLASWPTVAPGLHNRLDDVLSGEHGGWFTTRLGAKDLRLARELAAGSGLDLPIAGLVERRYEEAAERGWAGHDIAAIVELLRDGPRKPGGTS